MTMIDTYWAQPVARPADYFIGAHEARLGKHGRLLLPAPFRVALAGGGMLTCGFDGCLHLLPPQGWQRVAHHAHQLAPLSEQARQQRRLIFGSAVAVCPDEQGQITVPADLLKYAGIRERVILSGVASYIEIWAIHRWQDMRDQLRHGSPQPPRSDTHTGDAAAPSVIHLNQESIS